MNKVLLASGTILLTLAGVSLFSMISSFIISILVGADIIGSGGDYSWMRRFLGINHFQWFGLLLAFAGGTFLLGLPGALLFMWRDLRKNFLAPPQSLSKIR